MLQVSVLVDLLYGPAAGGHVKCWERLAEAATRLPPGVLDLTVHFAAESARDITLSPRVRYRLHRPRFSTSRLPFLSHIPDHTDLAPWHPALARALRGAQVIHTTDAFFAFARTAERLGRRGVPLVNSVHTDTPGYTRLYTGATVRRLVGTGALSRWLLDGLGVDARAAEDMRHRLRRHQALCRHALVSRPEELPDLAARLGPGRAGLMGRGIDTGRFDPARRDRAALAAAWGIPPDAVLVLAVGRVNRGKNILVLAEAVARLRQEGLPLHLFCAGEGDERAAVSALLGPGASCPGAVAPEPLSLLYAAADLFAFPSEIEVMANVVMEGLASGLPVLVSARGGMGRLLGAPACGVVVAGSDATAWADALRPLARSPEQRAALGAAARQHALSALPSWDDVLAQDLLPVWRKAAGAAA